MRVFYSGRLVIDSSHKLAAENSNKLKLTKIKDVYRHQKEHLYFSNPAKFQHFRCNIS